jgi:hypothetical protein
MNTATATFWGDSIDNYGMPMPFYRYFIVEDLAEFLGKDSRIVSILALTSPGPLPSPNDCPFKLVGVTSKEALEKAFDVLSKHPQLIHLSRQLSIKS